LGAGSVGAVGARLARGTPGDARTSLRAPDPRSETRRSTHAQVPPNGPSTPETIKPVEVAAGLNPADFNPNWRNLDESRQRLLPARLQGFSAETQAMQYRFTRERSLVRAQPCPSENPANERIATTAPSHPLDGRPVLCRGKRPRWPAGRRPPAAGCCWGWPVRAGDPVDGWRAQHSEHRT